jgi:hypothetical protein
MAALEIAFWAIFAIAVAVILIAKGIKGGR